MFLLFAMGAVIALCALLWSVAIYALPVFVGVSIGFWALSLGAGLGAPLLGLVAGAACWELAKIAFAHGNSTTKAGVAVLLAVPAGYMGFEIVSQLCGPSVTTPIWRTAFGLVAGLACAGTLLARLAQSQPGEWI